MGPSKTSCKPNTHALGVYWDYNEILYPWEKWGGRGRSNKHMKDFQQALEVCELHDLGFRGPKFTWSNCQDGYELIKERLDRGSANLEWRVLFPDAEVVAEVATHSDHAALILRLYASGDWE